MWLSKLWKRIFEFRSHLERESVKVLGAAVLIKPLQDKIGVAEIVNRDVPCGSEISHGDVVDDDQPLNGAQTITSH